MIRPATVSDIAAITGIYREAVLTGTASFEIEPPDEAEMLRRFEAMRDAGFPYLVHEGDGSVTAYAYAGAFRPRPAYRFSVENSVYVAQAAQGRGLGRLLVEALIEICAAEGYHQMIAVIGDGSRDSASVRFHQALGFAHAGIIRGSGWKFGRWLDTVIMQKPLNGGTGSEPDPDSLPERRLRLSQP